MRDDVAEQVSAASYVAAQRVPAREVARWVGPWLLAGVLVIVLVLGLVTASGAADSGTYWLGVVGAVLALVILLWQLDAALGGRPLPSLLVDEPEPLVITIALLALLAMLGLVLAARSESSAVNASGYALFIASLLIGFANLKHYFDRQEARRAKDAGPPLP
jgi:hypothetical protein